MKTYQLFAALFCLAATACVNGSDISDLKACDLSSPESIAKAYGIKSSTVNETTPRKFRNDSTTICEWAFTDAENHQINIQLFKMERRPKFKPNHFSLQLDYILRKGDAIGPLGHVEFREATIDPFPSGVLSDNYGMPTLLRYSNSRQYGWHENEERLIKLTITKTRSSEDTEIELLNESDFRHFASALTYK